MTRLGAAGAVAGSGDCTRTSVRPGPAATGPGPRRSARDEDGPDAAESQPVLRRRRQVELAPARVRAAVDDAHPDHPPPMAERQWRAARQRLVRHPELAGPQRPAAAQVVAV